MIMKNNKIFVTEIQINESRNIKNLNIQLSDKERKHLIITGQNGSGKTSLLRDLYSFLMQVDKGKYSRYKHLKEALDITKGKLETRKNSYHLEDRENVLNGLKSDIANFSNDLRIYGGAEIIFSNPDTVTEMVRYGKFIIGYFAANRHINLNRPIGPKKLILKKKYNIDEHAGIQFVQYLVNMHVDKSFARDDNDLKSVADINKWFDRLLKYLKKLIGTKKLELKFDRKSYNFQIIEGNKKPYGFDTLADGFSSILDIVSELIMRMEGSGAKSYNLEGIVLIDEIETHLHVELQKEILPFLTSIFPNIQFIITTHSPFVLSSLSNAIICDLESRIIANDLSAYSYDALIESYFKIDKYSDIIKSKIKLYEKLISKTRLEENEQLEFRELRNYFAHAPKYLSKELLGKLQQIEQIDLNKE